MGDSRRQDPFAELYGEFSDRLRGDRWRPDADVYETSDEVVVRVELAGVASGSVQVSIDGAAVRIAGVREPQAAAPIERLHQMEIATGPFDRRIPVPVAFERDHVSAHLSEGFLTVTLRKRGQRTVPIESD